MGGQQDLGAIAKIVVPVVTFILGYLFSRLTMTKKEQKDYQARLQDHSNTLLGSLFEHFQVFASALAEYGSKSGPPTLQEFHAISVSGEGYFVQLKMICDSILSENIDGRAIGNTHRQYVRDAVEKVLPEYYSTLQEIAMKFGLPFSGELKRENYESVFAVYERFCRN